MPESITWSRVRYVLIILLAGANIGLLGWMGVGVSGFTDQPAARPEPGAGPTGPASAGPADRHEATPPPDFFAPGEVERAVLRAPAALGYWPDPLRPAPGRFPAFDSTTGLDYHDPAANGRVPLVPVAGLENEFVSPHLRVKDFAARDGAPFARISPELVAGLERLIELAGAPVYINSGYRHPARNSDPEVGGAGRSQHLAGQAADVWSSEKTPLELAGLALEALGCEIGIGLGRNFLHLDVRGQAASWAQDDAEVTEAAFDAWVRGSCSPGGLRPDSSAALLARGRADHPAAGDENEAPTVGPDDPAAPYRSAMAAFARVQLRKGVPGAVVLDLRSGGSRPASFAYRLFYAPEGGEEARMLGVEGLLRSSPADRYFVFVVLGPGDEKHVGVMSHADPLPPGR